MDTIKNVDVLTNEYEKARVFLCANFMGSTEGRLNLNTMFNF
jgi:hypothetical protein